MTRTLTVLLASAAVALPGAAMAEAHTAEPMSLEMAQEMYPDMTMVEFEILDDNSDGVLDARELEELEDNEFTVDDDD